MLFSRHSPRGTLAASALGFAVVLLDVSVVNVALEALRLEFATDIAGLQWVVNAYTLAFAALLLTSGALGDRFGARRVFSWGFVLFTLASLACGIANELATLVVARLAQGVGAAMLVPNSLSMLQKAFQPGEERSRAVGWWGAVGGLSLAAGPVVGGLLVTHLGWRSIFLMNLPIGLMGLFLTLRFAAPDGEGHRRCLDWPGQVAAVIALASLTASLIEASSLGWSDIRVQAGLLLFIVALAGFIWMESRTKTPMLPLTLFRNPTFTISSVTGVVVNFAYYGLVFVLSLFFQIQQQLTPQQTGLAFLPMTIVLVAANIVAGRLMTRLGARRILVLGLGLAACGYLLMLLASIDGRYGMLIIPMLMAGSGIALTIPTMTNATMSSVDASRAGIASGVLNSARQIGGMLGVAVFGYLVRDTAAQAFRHGMYEAMVLSVALLFLGGLLCFVGMPKVIQEGIAASEKKLRPATLRKHGHST
ncbi:MFS transporter [Thauera linaloolentis]|uniref:MFS family transmembrane transporter n=1 Tax=Thauera linaloolentis (strain DSM 12138 / JCM 21573 / CCUG 41526 / CIP 105981 / IAM 15112 / NBRC 102519 / 47Lol) TaxID=1123367 RepID=N6YZS9_THAL4|nr:MFS transporter [Thauera linaloolentis]ENO87673.1 MFS family transmembrane transporter [Thauera linaloolentis 47Lol = DSM 12138]MCM8566001.1 MFS transporter [Thauera linaloolentis]